jgi:methylmalonyl-CoA/ethylmalonyl-CoA epimerase
MVDQGREPHRGPDVHAALAGLLLRVDHVGIAVRDMDEAVLLWERLGLHEVHRETNVEQHVHEVMLAVRDDNGSQTTRLQLLAPTDDNSALARFLDRSGPGLQQLAFTVTDVEQAAAALRQAGFRVLYDTPRRGTSGSRINFVHPKDCGGVLVEIVEPVVGNHP